MSDLSWVNWVQLFAAVLSMVAVSVLARAQVSLAQRQGRLLEALLHVAKAEQCQQCGLALVRSVSAALAGTKRQH